MKQDQVQAGIETFFRRKVQKDAGLHNAYLRVHSEKPGIDMSLAEGKTGGVPAHPDQPFYIASISKLFTSVLFGQLAERSLLDFEDPISMYVDAELLDGLHVYKGVDYTNQIRIKHLLNHTSGLHDFMEDKTKAGTTFMNLVQGEPDRVWTPQNVVQWSNAHLKSHFPPGGGFHYSDTGYHLLGLIVERVTGLPFHEALRRQILEPCGMVHSYLANYSEPAVPSSYPIARLHIGSIDITEFRSLSMMFAGGGIVSTTSDLLKFMKALVRREILKEDTFEQMKDWAKFFPGIDYGYGLMSVKPVPLFMPRRFKSWGNAGSTGTFMFYHPAMDAYFIGAFNKRGYSAKALRFMFRVMDKVMKV